MGELSLQAKHAMLQGATAMCPGCLIEKVIPENHFGAALHRMPDGGSTYECHANSEAWEGVPEFEEQAE